VVGSEEIFATPALPFEDKLHDPTPLGQSSDIRQKAGRKRMKNRKKKKKSLNLMD